MDPPPEEPSRRGAAGNGGKGRKTRRLGLKLSTAPAPTPSPTAPIPSPTAPAPSLPPTAPAATPSPTAPAPTTIPTAPTCPLQGARWASIPPSFAQDPNSWIYPPGGFLNILQQPLGENFHMIGQNVAFNQISPSHPANSYGTPSPQGTDQAMEEEIRLPTDEKERRYAAEQEGARKDIERAFGVLQRRFCILKRPARLYDRAVLRDVVLACIILHNMIVEDEKEANIIEENLDLNVTPSSTTIQEPEFSPSEEVPLERVLEKDTTIRDQSAHRRLKKDLVEHIWNKFGPLPPRPGI